MVEPSELLGKTLQFGKWVAGAIGGAALLKLCSDMVNEFKIVTKMRAQIYQEIARNYETLGARMYLRQDVEDSRISSGFTRELRLSRDIFDYYDKGQRDTLLKLPEVATIIQIYKIFARLESAVLLSDDFDATRCAKELLICVRESPRKNTIRGRVLNKFCGDQLRVEIRTGVWRDTEAESVG